MLAVGDDARALQPVVASYDACLYPIVQSLSVGALQEVDGVKG